MVYNYTIDQFLARPVMLTENWRLFITSYYNTKIHVFGYAIRQHVIWNKLEELVASTSVIISPPSVNIRLENYA